MKMARRERPMNDNQHYITKAHLDKFIHPTSGQNILHPYVRTQGIHKAKGTKRLACADSFFHQRDGAEMNNKLDEARKQIESRVFASGKATSGPLAKCIYDDTFLPNKQEGGELILAAAFLWWSSPVQIQNSAMMSLLCSQADFFNRLNSEEAKALYEKRYGEEAEARLQADRDAVLKGDLIVDVGEENWRQLGFSSTTGMDILGDQLSYMTLEICRCHPDSFFLTSDNPVIVLSATKPDKPGLALPDARVWFPISYNRGLLWTHNKGKVGNVLGVSRSGFGHSETRNLNRQIIKWCYKEVYSPLPGAWIDETMKANSFDPCFGHYGSLNEVIEAHSAPAFVERGNALQRKGEVVDLIAGLKSGEKCDAVGIGRPI